MALTPTLARSASKHTSAYGTALDRFLLTHPPTVAKPRRSPRSTPSSSSSVFEPTKSATTGCWAPPKYSLRRQAALVKEAALTGQLSSLPDGPRTARVTQRLQKLAAAHALDETAAQYQFRPSTNSVAAKPTKLGERPLKHSHRIPAQERAAALAAAKEHVQDVGPYAGRAKVFKGSREDRGKTSRELTVQGRLEGMQQAVKDWQEGLSEARGKAKPGLPF